MAGRQLLPHKLASPSPAPPPPPTPNPPPEEEEFEGEELEDDDIDDVDDDGESSYTSSSDDEDWGEDDEDEMIHAMVEQAREDIRRQLRELKAVYRSIRQRNIEIPEQFRIQESSLKLPSEIYAHTFEKIEEECDEVYRVHEYESAEALIQLDKLRKFYFDPIETPHIVVKEISHVLQVHTIRNRKSTLEFEELLAKNTEIVEEEKRLLREQTLAAEMLGKEALYPVKRVYAKELIGEYEDSIHTFNVETVHNIRHLEKRLAQKYERECAWYELMAKKIPPDYIPPEDVEVLSQAKTNTGEYRLQSAESYLGEKTSTAERRQRILNIKIAMREEVQNFNKLVIEARDEKPLVIQECRRLEREIRKVHVLLPEEYRRKIPPIYEMEPDETSEGLFDISTEEVEAEELNLLAAAGLPNIIEDIMEDFYGVKKPEKNLDEEERTKMKERSGTFAPPPAARTARQAKEADLEFESVASNRCRKVQFNAQSEAGRKKFEVQFYPRLYRQELLFKELTRVINYFYERIKYLHDLRVKLEIETRVKTIGLLSMIGELDIAKEFISQELEVEEVLKVQKMESKNAKKQMEKIKNRLVTVNEDMKTCEDTLIAINKDVEVTIGTKNRFHDFLWRVFRKKIKLDIEGDNDEEEQDDDEEEEEEEEDEDEDEEEEQQMGTEAAATPDNDDRPLLDKHGHELAPIRENDTMSAAKSALSRTRLDIDICPENCNRQVYDHIVELRLKKATMEYEMEKNKKLGEMTSAEYVEVENLFEKYQERSTEMAEELRVLQRRGQKKMNDLKLMIILRADQIQCMNMDELAEMDGEMLEKLAQTFPGTGNIVIFPKDGSTKLESRASDLIKKGRLELEKFKRGKTMLTRLYEEFHKAQKEVTSLKEKVKREMMQKFGQEVDLDEICASVINLELMRQEMLLEKTKMEHYKERAKVNEEVLEIKYELSEKIEENTKYNRMKAVMLERKRDLEYYILKNEKSLKESEEMGPQGDSPSILLPKLVPSLAQFATGSSNNFDYNKLDKDIENAKQLLEKQQNRICDLKRVLTKCRTKSGVPPLIKMAKDFIPPSEKLDQDCCTYTTTVKELPDYNEYCPKNLLNLCDVPTKKQSDYRSSNPNLGDYDFFAEMQRREMERNEGQNNYPEEELGEVDDEGDVLRPFPEPITLDAQDAEFAQLVEDLASEDLGDLEEEGEGRDEEERTYQEEQNRRSKSKRASRKSVMSIAEEAKRITEADVMKKIQRYSANEAGAELAETAEGLAEQGAEDVKQFLREGDEADRDRIDRDQRDADPRNSKQMRSSEANNSDPRRSDPNDSDPRRSERRSDPRRSVSKSSDTRRSDPNNSGPRRSIPTNSDPRRSERRSDPRRSDPKNSDPRRSDPKNSDPRRSDPSGRQKDKPSLR